MYGTCLDRSWWRWQVEAVIIPGKGKAISLESLERDEESVQAAQSYVHSNATKFGISPNLFEKHDIHVHVPEGATQKMAHQQELQCLQQSFLHLPEFQLKTILQ